MRIGRYDIIAVLKMFVPPIFSKLNTKWRDRKRRNIELVDQELYQPVFSPWLGGGEFGALRDHISNRTLVSADRLWVLKTLAQQSRFLNGDFIECGVYRGGTAYLLAEVIETHKDNLQSKLRLFDTFAGMPDTDPEVDKHDAGDFDDTSMASVKGFVGERSFISWHQGRVPDTFEGVDFGQVAFLHIDLDIRQSIEDTLNKLYSHMMTGGVIVFDDYGFPSCYGARVAVDEFFSDKPETPLSLPTGQAVVTKLAGVDTK